MSWILSECLRGENISILVEEEVQTLSNTNASELLETVVKIVNECLSEAPLFGAEAPKSALGTSEVLEIISHCNSVGGHSRRFWALSPLDGTMGFVNGDQYAVALSLIEDGEVVVGVLGCPNYPMRKDWLGYQQSYHRIMSKLISPTSETWNKGCVIYAKKDSGKAWIQPLIHHANKKFVWPNHAKQVSVSSVDNLGLATLCQTVEKANSSHSFTDGLAHSVGFRFISISFFFYVSYPSCLLIFILWGCRFLNILTRSYSYVDYSHVFYLYLVNKVLDSGCLTILDTVENCNQIRHQSRSQSLEKL